MNEYVVIADFEMTPAFLSFCRMTNGRKSPFPDSNYWIFPSKDTADGLCRLLRRFARSAVLAFRADGDWAALNSAH